MQPLSHNTLQVKQMNVELVKQTLKTQGPGTKSAMASATRLSIATCGTILNELVAAGEVIELEQDETNGGRPAKLYQYNADFGCALCLLVRTEGGLHSVSWRIVNLLAEIIGEDTLMLERIDVDVIDELIGKLIGEFGNVMAIGIGIPGVAHRGVIGVCDASELAGKPLGPYFEEKFGVPVLVENDMNMTVYGFYHAQEFEEETNFSVVTFPRNHYPGAGFIVEGRMLTGNTTFGGEVSFLPFGITREEQLRLLETEDGFIKLATHTLASIIAIINPAVIAITGDVPRTEHLEALQKGCLKDIPEEHMPKLIIQNNTYGEYMKGMVTATLESLTYRLQVIEKR